jgi:hypothetical protein
MVAILDLLIMLLQGRVIRIGRKNAEIAKSAQTSGDQRFTALVNHINDVSKLVDSHGKDIEDQSEENLFKILDEIKINRKLIEVGIKDVNKNIQEVKTRQAWSHKRELKDIKAEAAREPALRIHVTNMGKIKASGSSGGSKKKSR